jgi:hypothetical protein
MSSNDDTAYFKTFAPAVCANGYSPIPVRPGTKVSRLARWQFLCGRSASPRGRDEVTLAGSGATAVSRPVLDIKLHRDEE